jgi:Ca-activated chloride channel family protein
MPFFENRENAMFLRSSRFLIPTLVGILLLAGVSSNAQLSQRASDQTYRIDVYLVNVLCSVFDKKTKSFVTAFSKNDFSIFENGREQEITNFTRETDLPLTLAILVDTSSSVAPKLQFEQDAAISFFYNVLKENDRAMLVEFNSSVNMLQDFTEDPNKLANQVRKLRAGGNSSLFDAIDIVCDQKMIRETGRKALIILSDGDDTGSAVDYRRAIEMALRAESVIFPVSVSKGGFFGTGDDTKKGDKTLQNLAKETGGKVFFPFKVEELEDAFREINQELRSQYSIGYISTNPKRDGSYRKLEIRVRERNMDLNYRKGYYAPFD